MNIMPFTFTSSKCSGADTGTLMEDMVIRSKYFKVPCIGLVLLGASMNFAALNISVFHFYSHFSLVNEIVIPKRG